VTGEAGFQTQLGQAHDPSADLGRRTVCDLVDGAQLGQCRLDEPFRAYLVGERPGDEGPDRVERLGQPTA
jgi:hypothetical protein